MVAVLLRFFKDPRNDEIALQHFFFFLTAAQEFFFYYICAACNFFLPTSACRKFFFKITHNRVKWLAVSYREVTNAVLYLGDNLYYYTRTRRTPTSSCLSVLMWFSMTRQKKLQEREAQRLLRS